MGLFEIRLALDYDADGVDLEALTARGWKHPPSPSGAFTNSLTKSFGTFECWLTRRRDGTVSGSVTLWSENFDDRETFDLAVEALKALKAELAG